MTEIALLEKDTAFDSEQVFMPWVLQASQNELKSSRVFKAATFPDEKEAAFRVWLSKKHHRPGIFERRRLKDIVRKHIDPALRYRLWKVILEAEDPLETLPAFYDDQLESLFGGKGNLGLHDIPNHIGSQYQFLSYHLDSVGIIKLSKVLYVLLNSSPDITYCPLLEPIAAVMLHFMDEKDCFVCLSGLLQTHKKSYLTQTRTECAIVDAAFQDICRSKMHKEYTRLQSFVDEDLQSNESGDEKVKRLLFPGWQKMLFERLEFSCLVRVMDCLIIEGPKVLYRLGLHIIRLFYDYSLNFQRLGCPTPFDLVTLIGQFTTSVTFSAEHFIKTVTSKISLKTRHIESAYKVNQALLKAKELQVPGNWVIQHVTAVDMSSVSDIINAHEWMLLCEWLPARVQILQPRVLFSTEKHGYNLRTLYLKCEEEEQSVVIIKTTTGEIFGAFLSRQLEERKGGKKNLKYFGTGETFIFKLLPESRCYPWVGDDVTDHATCGLHQHPHNHYIFVDPIPDLPPKPKISKKPSFHRLLSRQCSGGVAFRHERTRDSPPLRQNRKSLSAINSAANFNTAFDFRALDSEIELEKVSGVLRTYSGHDLHRLHQDSINVCPTCAKLKDLDQPSVRADSKCSCRAMADFRGPLAGALGNSMSSQEFSAQFRGVDEADDGPILMKTLGGVSSSPATEDGPSHGRVDYRKKRKSKGDEADGAPFKQPVVKERQGHVDAHAPGDEHATADPHAHAGAHAPVAPRAPLEKREGRAESKLDGAGFPPGSLSRDLFICCDDSNFIVGGGGGEGIWLDGDLRRGRSSHCHTFDNPSLTSCEGGDFLVARVDVFGFA